MQTMHKNIAAFYVVNMFSKYLSRDQFMKDRKN